MTYRRKVATFLISAKYKVIQKKITVLKACKNVFGRLRLLLVERTFDSHSAILPNSESASNSSVNFKMAGLPGTKRTRCVFCFHQKKITKMTHEHNLEQNFLENDFEGVEWEVENGC